ncbi:LuxR C-terminal-related transcriptional regulator [Streptomyces sp. 4F14]|uniref:response regulator transcription factor n=1 Tax=Streptomyces sp. 4F14 TaxID=3394380 RepID=UPI003A83F054
MPTRPPTPAALTVALVSHDGTLPGRLPRGGVRVLRSPGELRPHDDVVLFYGTGMAVVLKRYADSVPGALPPALVLADRLDWDDVHLALRHGARGYLLEHRDGIPLTEALLCTARGASVLAPEIAASRARGPADRRSRLSPRERQVMDQLAVGLGVREIARRMVLTHKTVRDYVSRIYGKLGVHSRAEAVLCWLGHVEPGEAGR